MWKHAGAMPDLCTHIKYALRVFIIGALVTISLPMGTIAGLSFKPNHKLTAVFTVFWTGALQAALRVELIGPTVEEIGGHINSPTGMEHRKKRAHRIFIGIGV